MKKFLIIFCLVAGTLFVYAGEGKITFIDMYSGASFNRDLKGAESALLVGFGREIKNSDNKYLGVLGFGVWGDNFTIGYEYGRKINRNSLAVVAGVGLGALDDSLAVGGEFGFRMSFKVSEFFDFGVRLGIRTQRGLAEGSEWSSSENIMYYTLFGARHYF